MTNYYIKQTTMQREGKYMEEVREECKGCYRKITYGCGLKESRNCPCMICIIKGICISTCEERYLLWKNQFGKYVRDSI